MVLFSKTVEINGGLKSFLSPVQAVQFIVRVMTPFIYLSDFDRFFAWWYLGPQDCLKSISFILALPLKIYSCDAALGVQKTLQKGTET